MSAPAAPLVTITVNEIELQVPKGELIVESVKRIGLEIPIFCYHPRMKPVGMCRMCLIEVATKAPDGTVRKMPKPQAACSLPASEGLIVWTDTAAIHKDRKGVLEFLLINHPLDCPICDRGGECPLQNNTLFYGPSTSRFVEMKRHAPKAFPLSQYVTLDLERCIQCGRCVRFTEEISGDAQLAFRFRGANMQPSTFQMTDFDSKFSGNVIEICPVGALTSTKYRFRARPWDLQTKEGICTVCSNGCNIFLDYRREAIARVNGRTNEAINEEWTCDQGKFGQFVYNSTDRITNPLIRKGNELVASDWAEVYNQILAAGRDGSVAAIAGTKVANEDFYELKRLLTTGFGSSAYDHRFGVVAGPTLVGNAIVDFETPGPVVVVGTALAESLPIVYLRVRKGWFHHGNAVTTILDRPTDSDRFATEAILAPAADWLTAVAQLEVAKLPSARFILTSEIYRHPQGREIVAAVKSLAEQVGGSVNVYATGTNEEGAQRIGFHGDRTATQLLEAAARGEIRALWLAGVDPFAVGLPETLVTAALENVEFLIVQDWSAHNQSLPFASVVLPQTSPVEAEGSFTNVDGQVQWQPAVLPVKGMAKPLWRVASELLVRTKPQTPMFNAREVLSRLQEEVPALAGSR